MSSKRIGILILIATAAMTIVAGSACTSSSSNVATNPGFRQQYNNPTRTPDNYAGQQAPAGDTKPLDLPVTVMQISFDTGRLEVNEAYNLYALIDNPSNKDIKYQWRATGGKLLPVLESDKEKLKSLIDSAVKPETAPAPGAGAPIAPPAGQPAQDGERMVDGKVIPGGVPPDEALKQRQTPAAGGTPETFRDNEPVPPPQIQSRPSAPATAGEPPATPPVELAKRLNGLKLASNFAGRDFKVRYAALEQAIEDAEVVVEENVDEPAGAEDSGAAEDDGEGGAEESEPENAEAEAEESEATGFEVPDAPNAERLSGIPVDTEIAELEKPKTEFSIFDRETGAGRHWPTPWESVSPGKRDAGEKLIEDIQGQIIAQADAEAAAVTDPSNKAVTMLTVGDPFVRFIPDTAESVTLSLVVVSAKEVAITEPTVLDAEVLTPQPGVELKYTLPKEGLEPGDKLEVNVHVKNIPDYKRSLLGINFELNNFEVSKVALGDLFGGTNNASLFYAQPDKSSGLVTVAVSLEDILRTVRGSGNAFVLTFEAKAPIEGDLKELGFSISGDAAYRYIQDTAGDNQLPAPVGDLPPLQTVYVAPQRPAETLPAAQPGMDAGVEGVTPGVGPGGPPALGGPPAISGAPGVDSKLQGGAGMIDPRTGQPIGPLAPGGTPTDTGKQPPAGPLPPAGQTPDPNQKPPPSSDGPKSAKDHQG